MRLLVYAVSLLSLSSICQAQVNFGPIESRNLRALQLPFFRFEPRNRLTPAGEATWTAHLSIANDFRQLPRDTGNQLTEDLEMWRLGLRYRKGLNDGTEIDVEIPLLSRGTGILDPIIDGWHESVLKWVDSGRDRTAFGQSVVRYPGGQFGVADGLGDVSATFSRKLSRRVDGSVAVKLPTGDAGQLLGSGSLDLGIALNYETALDRRWRLFAMGGVVAQGRGTLEGTRGLAHQASLALVYQANSRDAWIAQWQSESAGIQTGLAGSDATHRILVFGYQRRMSARERLDLYFTEDRDVFEGSFPEGANVGPDFGIGIAWRVKL